MKRRIIEKQPTRRSSRSPRQGRGSGLAFRWGLGIMKNRNVILLGLALLIVGIVAGYFLSVVLKARTTYAWRALSLETPGKGYGYSSEALFGSDIALPEIKKMSGTFKFLDAPTKDELRFGYLVLVDIDKLDLKNVPQRYKIEKKETYTAGTFTTLPIDEVVYSVKFHFKLKDKDGFELVNFESQPCSVSSGKVNEFQNVIDQTITLAMAERVSSAFLSMTVQKCETCK